MKARTSTPPHITSAWLENTRPLRVWATSQPTSAAPTMASPPIVGVPDLDWW